MDFTLIPFGILVSTNDLIDVESVENGAGCNCICPSCKIPLVARQGSEKVWHFAHRSRTVAEKAEHPCEYSFFVSVRLMARQVFSKGITIHLPEYTKLATREHPVMGHTQELEYTITQPSKIELSSVELEPMLAGTPIDVIAAIGKYRLAFYFSHPHRSPPIELRKPTFSKFGAVEIDLLPLAEIFRRTKPGESFKEKLIDYLTDRTEVKRWLYHPRQEAEEEKAQKQLNSPYFNSMTLLQLKCIDCLRQWKCADTAPEVCPYCHSRFFITL